MKRLAPYRGTLFRLAVLNALLVGVVALAFVYVDRASQRGASGTFVVDSGRQDVGSAREAPAIAGLSAADKRFVRAAAELTWEEIKVAELGSRRATHPAVRNLADQLAAYHTSARNEIEALAIKKGLPLPTGEPDSADADRVASVAGAEFDAAFVEWAAQTQAAVLKLFQEAARESDDLELRQMAMEMLPRLQMQYEHVRLLRRAIY